MLFEQPDVSPNLLHVLEICAFSVCSCFTMSRTFLQSLSMLHGYGSLVYVECCLSVQCVTACSKYPKGKHSDVCGHVCGTICYTMIYGRDCDAFHT